MSDYSEDDPNPSRKYIFGKPLKPGQITFGEYSKTPEGQAFLEEIADLIKNVVDGINDDPVNQSNLAKLKLMLDSSDPHDRVFAKYILDSPIENIYEFRQAFLDEIQNVKLPPTAPLVKLEQLHKDGGRPSNEKYDEAYKRLKDSEGDFEDIYEWYCHQTGKPMETKTRDAFRRAMKDRDRKTSDETQTKPT